MERWLGKYSGTIYGIMRFVIGFLFFCHGAQKVFGWFGGPVMMSNPLTATAGIIELVGGGLIALGLWAGWVAFICSGEMAVAYFMGHFGHGGFWPIQNHGEVAVLYCFIFLYIAAHGSGGLSLEGMGRKRR
jgi:putative oxidoreductase